MVEIRQAMEKVIEDIHLASEANGASVDRVTMTLFGCRENKDVMEASEIQVECELSFGEEIEVYDTLDDD